MQICILVFGLVSPIVRMMCCNPNHLVPYRSAGTGCKLFPPEVLCTFYCGLKVRYAGAVPHAPAIFLLTVLGLFLSAAPARSHNGGLDANGCHKDTKTRTYHCHQGPLAGRELPSKKAAEATLWLIKKRRESGRDRVELGAGARVTATDGDSLRIDGQRLRLHGIDAPEMEQTCTAFGRAYPCGKQAKQALARMVEKGVRCELIEPDSYGRFLAHCHTRAGASIGAAMVRGGWALAYRHYSRAYVAEEEAAKKARAGIWAGDFTPPWAWRRGHELPAN